LKDMNKLVVVGDRNYSNNSVAPTSPDNTISATPIPSEYNPIL